MKIRKTIVASQIMLLFSPWSAQLASAQDGSGVTELETIYVTPAEQVKQSLGASEVSAKDIDRQGVTNDLSEIIRKQPGVNLTGNSTSGQRGNNRQIEIRGMGPENTLILVDGKPVRSRNSVRYSRRNERDTRGDSNWVPAEMVQSIEVYRGPAAARYGDGAAGGVVNIITKKKFDAFSGSVNTYYAAPYHDEEGDTKRANFNLMTPLGGNFGLRVYGSYNKTDADAWYINLLHNRSEDGSLPSTITAGREGVKNRDGNVLLRWSPAARQTLDLEFSNSRQENIYAGDAQISQGTVDAIAKGSGQFDLTDLIGQNSNTMTRNVYSLTYNGSWDNVSNTTYVQYENTRNNRYDEGLSGLAEGAISGDRSRITSRLNNLDIMSETTVNFRSPFAHSLTLGLGYTQARLHDMNIVKQQVLDPDDIGDRSPDYKTKLFSLTLEDNIILENGLTITPGVFYERHNVIGSSLNPSLNVWYALNDEVTLKAGVARAYKSPNIYQLDPDYRMYSQGFGCWGGTGPCYVRGNEDLEAEKSLNSEIGLEYKSERILTNLTFFNNDYKNKVEPGIQSEGKFGSLYEYQYYNVPRAIVRGLESTFNVRLTDRLSWDNNATYMIKSKNRDTGEALSTTPKFTLNSILAWDITDRLNANVMVTWYGKQKSRTLDSRGEPYLGEDRDPYALLSVSGTFRVSKHLNLRAGVNNVFDKQLYRSGAGANTYNEPGRLLWAGASVSF